MTGTERLKAQMINAIHHGPEHVPEAGVILWHAFTALNRTRTTTGLAPNPITYTEIEAWSRLFRMPLQPHHVDILTAMDHAWLKGDDTKTAPKSPITPAAFDAVFG